MFWEHREDTEPVPPQCDVSQSRKPLIFQEPLCKGSKQNTENTVMTDPSGVNGLSNFFFFQNSWKKEFWNDPQSWKHVENWVHISQYVSQMLCLYRKRKSSNDNLHFSTPLRKLYSPHMRGRRIITPILYWSYLLIYLVKKKKKWVYVVSSYPCNF